MSQESALPGDQTVEEEDEAELDDAFGICFTTTESKCEELYERGMLLKSQGQLEAALTCLVESLKRMQECQFFAKLPHTLHELAELCNTMEKYDKAVEFAQAEKLFYEAVLIDYHGSKRESKSRYAPANKSSDPADFGDLLVKKASEFEKLSRLCARDKNFQLALDYCGKAAKIRQSVFGQEHPSTTATLEYFTELYAEVGRRQYAAAMQRMRKKEEPGNLTTAVNPKVEALPQVDAEAGDFAVEEDNQRTVDEEKEQEPAAVKEGCAVFPSSLHAENKTACASGDDPTPPPPPTCSNKEPEWNSKDDHGGESYSRRVVNQLFYHSPLWLIILAAVVIIGLTFT